MGKIASAAMSALILLASGRGATVLAADGQQHPMSPQALREVQHALQHAHHYEVGPADGTFGDGLRAALWYFQQESNLRTTGAIDRETLTALHLSALRDGVPSARDLLATAERPEPPAGGGVFGTPLSRQ
jgi:hypothetical protein